MLPSLSYRNLSSVAGTKKVASGLNQLNRRVQVFQFDAGIVICKLPTRFHIMFISMSQPCDNLFFERALVWNSSCQALAGEDG